MLLYDMAYTFLKKLPQNAKVETYITFNFILNEAHFQKELLYFEIGVG